MFRFRDRDQGQFSRRVSSLGFRTGMGSGSGSSYRFRDVDQGRSGVSRWGSGSGFEVRIWFHGQVLGREATCSRFAYGLGFKTKVGIAVKFRDEGRDQVLEWGSWSGFWVRSGFRM